MKVNEIFCTFTRSISKISKSTITITKSNQYSFTVGNLTPQIFRRTALSNAKRRQSG